MTRFVMILLSVALLTGCRSSGLLCDPNKITSINIIDRNGLSETISSKDRLGAFENTDFLAPQPYQKVMRVYGREKNGDTKACLTSYHPNGQVKQFLEVVNNRAFGTYREWFQNGQLKIDAHVIGGISDLNTQAEQSWLFQGNNRAWDEEGTLIAEVHYEKGDLHGISTYYHPNGQIWKRTPYVNNALHGVQEIYLEDASLFLSTEYVKGVKEGASTRFWEGGDVAYQEHYTNGKLLEATYYDLDQTPISQIQGGNGYRAILGKRQLHGLHEYKNGNQDGLVKIFDEGGNLVSLYSVKSGEKHGEEIDYFPSSTQPKLLMTWSEGALQGPVKTWYENGNLESQREICRNEKNGLLTAWYQNGALMLVEDYERDALVKGEYFRIGEKTPVSKVEKGEGVATLFNSDGNFSRKVYYQNGKPID